MKKILAAVLFLCEFVLSASAQNWRPFNPDYRYHYQFGSADEITHTIFSDSTTTLPDDTVFYLNRVLSFCDTCLYLKSIYCPEFDCVFNRNSPQFMQREVHYAMGSMFAMTDPDQYVINFQAQPGESWITDAFNDVIATVDSVKEVMILSSLDSVRYISTTNNRFIEISKNHGIIRYPDYATEEYYVLVGVSGLDVGERLPVMEDIFDFHAGDELVYSYSGNSAMSGCWNGTKKMRFMSRTDFADSTIYDVENVISYHSWNCITPWKPMNIDSYYTTTETITLRNSDFTFLDTANPFSLVTSESYVSNWQNAWTQNGYYVPVYTNKNEFGYELSYGPFNTENFGCSYYIQPEESDEPQFLVRGYSDDGWSNGSIYCGTLDVTFGEGRGIVHTYQSDNFEFEEEYIQIGTLIGGDTTGMIPSDATILLSRELSEIEVSIYPNPVRENFTIQSDASISSIEVWDTLGKLVLLTNPAAQNAVVDAKNLPAGVYVVRVKTSVGIRILRIVIE